jgi:uncharacterized membrane-anchored protein
MRRDLWLVVALALPLVAVAVSILRAEEHLAHSRTWTFDIEAYDPSDLIRGRYLQYRLVLDQGTALDACPSDEGPECCLCLPDVGPGVAPRVQRGTCEVVARSCAGRIQTQYLSELQRFYVPESRANELERRLRESEAPRRAQIEVAVDAAGKPQTRALIVDGERLEPAAQ